MSALVSIIIPVYNVEEYVAECIESVINQTYKNLEIIIVNDGSTDNSLLICETYAKQDIRIKIIDKKNGGISSARNAGLENATGEYIGFVDSDDYIAEDMYERLVGACINNNAKASVCHAVTFTDGSKPFINTGFIKKDYCTTDIKQIFSNTLIMSQSLCNKLFKKSLFKNISFPLNKVDEDGYVVYDLLYRAKKVAYVALGGYFYRRRENSYTTRKYVKQDADFFVCNVRTYYRIKKIIPSLWDEGVERAVNKGLLPVMKKVTCLNVIEFFKARKSFYLIKKALEYMEKDLAVSQRISARMKKRIRLFVNFPTAFYFMTKVGLIKVDDERGSRINLYEDISNQWDLNKRYGKKIDSHLRKNGICDIAIYGMGTMGERLYNELKDSEITITCFIDRAADKYEDGIDGVKLILPEVIGSLNKTSAIIVTPVHVYEDIKEVIKNSGYKGKVISLETIVFDL